MADVEAGKDGKTHDQGKHNIIVLIKLLQHI